MGGGGGGFRPDRVMVALLCVLQSDGLDVTTHARARTCCSVLQ